MLKQLISEIHVVQQFQSCSAGKTFIENCNTYTETLFLGWVMDTKQCQVGWWAMGMIGTQDLTSPITKANCLFVVDC